MRRADVWWADLPDPMGRRPVVLLSRDEAYGVREFVTVALVTSRIRGIPAEVPLGPGEGLSRGCVANMDMIHTIAKRCLVKRIGELSAAKVKEADRAVHYALGLRD